MRKLQDKGTLVLAFIAGLSIGGTCAVLFRSVVPFSIFPVFTLLLAVYGLHQRYQNRTMPVGLPGIAVACFALGVLVYSAILRVEYQSIGSNFVPSILSVILVFWIVLKIQSYKKHHDVAEANFIQE